jgi:hypothetical protein
MKDSLTTQQRLFLLSHHAQCKNSLTQKGTADLIEKLFPQLFEKITI